MNKENKLVLYKNSKKGKLSGVCAGLSEVFNLDVTIIRLIFGIGVLTGGIALPIYILCAIIFPEKDSLMN